MMRWLKGVGLALVAVFVLAAGLLLWYRQASLPEHEGRLVASGLGAPVAIRRDDEDVPAIFANSEADALFALGIVHAQDRLWQIDFNRRIAQGRLAELLGPKALETDKFLRTLGVYRTAQRIAANLDPDTRVLVDSYVAGINAALTARSGPLPPEFLLTRAPPPAPWTAADSIAWTMMMAWDLSSMSYRNELSRLRLALRLSKAEIDEFRPPYPGEQPLATTDYVELYRQLGLRAPAAAAFRQGLSRLALAHPGAGFGDGEGIGSNNWVVSGSRTVSGWPLLANDPHLGLTTPSVWYFAQLHAPGLDVFGATLPGVPFVLLGRNRHVAWGLTNTGSDLQDLYLEQLDPNDGERYKAPDGYASFTTRNETISVRGADAVALTVRESRHGPVLSGAATAVDQALAANKGQFVLALRWTALEPVDHTLRAIRNMNRANNASEFAAALRDWTLVQQNVAFADDHGDIGMIAPGRVPVRKPDNDLRGLAPAPGWESRYDWEGWLPFEQMPKIMNPPSGMIVTANHKITPPGYQPYLT